MFRNFNFVPSWKGICRCHCNCLRWCDLCICSDSLQATYTERKSLRVSVLMHFPVNEKSCSRLDWHLQDIQTVAVSCGTLVLLPPSILGVFSVFICLTNQDGCIFFSGQGVEAGVPGPPALHPLEFIYAVVICHSLWIEEFAPQIYLFFLRQTTWELEGEIWFSRRLTSSKGVWLHFGHGYGFLHPLFPRSIHLPVFLHADADAAAAAFMGSVVLTSRRNRLGILSLVDLGSPGTSGAWLGGHPWRVLTCDGGCRRRTVRENGAPSEGMGPRRSKSSSCSPRRLDEEILSWAKIRRACHRF